MQGKIIEGILLARRLLIEKAVREDRKLVISREGKVLHIKAKNLFEEYSKIQIGKISGTAKRVKSTPKAMGHKEMD